MHNNWKNILKIATPILGAACFIASAIKISKVCYSEGRRDGYSLGYEEGVEWGAHNAIVVEDLNEE